MISIQFALRANFQGAPPPGYPRRAGARHLFTLHSSLFTWLPLRGSCRRSRLRGRPPGYRFLSGPAGPDANLLQSRDLRGLPGPGPRVTFWPARKSPKSRLREGGFRFPPSLKNLIPLKRPRPGASAPALDPPPPGALPASFLIGPLCGPGASAPSQAFWPQAKTLAQGGFTPPGAFFNQGSHKSIAFVGLDSDFPLPLRILFP